MSALTRTPANEDFDGLPDLMRNAVRWMLWRSEKNTNPTKRPNKVPYYANGSHRLGPLDSPSDQANFATFDNALFVLQAGGYSGLGFALGPDGTGNHWQGVDLDHLSERPGLRHLADDLPGYTETSPSGDGVHAIGYGREFKSETDTSLGIESYSAGRYFTVTGDGSGLHDPVCMADFVEKQLRPLLGARQGESRKSVLSPLQAVEVVEISMETRRDLRSALMSMRADNQGLWQQNGHRLKPLGKVGRDLFMEWSATSDKFDPLVAAKSWDGFKTDRTGYQAVFKAAQDDGWLNPNKSLTTASAEFDVPEAEYVAPSEVSIFDVLDAEPPAPEFIIADYIPCGVVTLLGANGGVGKSLLSLTAAVCVAMGLPFLGKRTKRCKVCFYSAEDSTGHLRHRLHKICRHLGVNPHDLATHLHILDATEGDPALFCEANTKGVKKGITTRAYAHLKEYIDDRQIDFVVIDNASDTYDANEIERARVRGFIRSLAQIVKGRNGAVLLLAHVAKTTIGAKGGDSQGYSGSTAWNNSVRSRLFMSEQGAGVLLEHQKSNLARKAEPVTLRWSANHILEVGGSTAVPDAGMLLIASMNLQSILKMMVEFEERGEFISTSASSPDNPFKKLSGELGYPHKLSKDRLSLLIRDADRDGLVIRERYKSHDRKPKERWLVTHKGQGVFAPCANPAPT